jgi:hypothetical protein
MRQLQWSVVILCAVLVMFACSKDDEPTSPGTTPTTSTLTDQQKAQISQSYRTIAASADGALLSASPHAAFQSGLATYQSDPAVEAVWLTDNALFVNYKNGGSRTTHCL